MCFLHCLLQCHSAMAAVCLQVGSPGGPELEPLRSWWRGRMGLDKEAQLSLFAGRRKAQVACSCQLLPAEWLLVPCAALDASAEMYAVVVSCHRGLHCRAPA